MQNQTVLLTGFEPFAGHAANPSQIIAERLHGETIGGARVVSLVLPVVFGADTERVFPAIDELKPAVVLSLGLSAARDCMDVELFGINQRMVEGSSDLIPIIADGPAAYFATIDADGVSMAMVETADIPAQRHGYAGSYLCNHILYQTLHYAQTQHLPLRAGFIHMPQATEFAAPGAPSLPLESMIAAVRAAIEETLH